MEFSAFQRTFMILACSGTFFTFVVGQGDGSPVPFFLTKAGQGDGSPVPFFLTKTEICSNLKKGYKGVKTS